jgi:Tol biopolymer transport system component
VAALLGVTVESRLQMSPDGKYLAYAFMDSVPEPVLRMAVIPVEGGPARVLQAPGWTYEGARLRWSPDGNGLQSLLTRDGATNIWEQPLAGGEPRQVTNFTSGRIFDFTWSADHQNLLLVRGDVSSDVVLLSNFR